MIDFKDLGTLVTAIGRPEFGQLYFELFRTALDIEQCTVFAFPDNAQPQSVLLEGGSVEDRQQARQLASIFLAGDFRHDPNLRRAENAASAIMITQSAALIEDPEFRKRFYDDPNLEHELIILGSVGRALIYASYYRGVGKPAFSEEEATLLQPFAQLLLPMLHRHLELSNVATGGLAFTSEGDRTVDRSVLLRHLTEVMLTEGNGLSPREAEVCACIVAGYSALAISLNLGISENTVTTHRKRAYSKLNVSSQNELFLRYFSTVARTRLNG